MGYTVPSDGRGSRGAGILEEEINQLLEGK
jgi:hypothetical protein